MVRRACVWWSGLQTLPLVFVSGFKLMLWVLCSCGEGRQFMCFLWPMCSSVLCLDPSPIVSWFIIVFLVHALLFPSFSYLVSIQSFCVNVHYLENASVYKEHFKLKLYLTLISIFNTVHHSTAFIMFLMILNDLFTLCSHNGRPPVSCVWTAAQQYAST